MIKSGFKINIFLPFFKRKEKSKNLILEEKTETITFFNFKSSIISFLILALIRFLFPSKSKIPIKIIFLQFVTLNFVTLNAVI